ncbi:MAG TPA: cupin domain-containing protein [Elusimicrobiota bacterium]|nr:cupin domain-containing protein [Elusimicrobiota bacterium]
MDEARLPEFGPAAAPLSAGVDYQTGSIVSRRIIQKPAGSVTLFAFDADQELSAHSAPFDALVYVVEGEAAITVDDRRQTVRAGEMILLPAEHPHAVQAPARFKMLLVMIR